ncbi:MAG: spore germination protein GerW family protein [Mycetocola sp.]
MDEQNTATQRKTNDLPAFLQPLLDRLQSAGKTDTIFGPSRQEHNRTIVPVARVSFGVGGGSGRAASKKPGTTDLGRPASNGDRPADEGTGGGGGVSVTPVGVFEVTDAGTRFFPVTTSKVAVGTFLAGLLLGLVLGRGTHS